MGYFFSHTIVTVSSKTVSNTNVYTILLAISTISAYTLFFSPKLFIDQMIILVKILLTIKKLDKRTNKMIESLHRICLLTLVRVKFRYASYAIIYYVSCVITSVYMCVFARMCVHI